MKKIYLSFVLVFLFIQVNAQCNLDRHNATWFDGWISCEIAENPNTARDSSHWIMYNFGNELEMHAFSVWNYNAPDNLNYGIKTAMVDYSKDGLLWEEYGIITLNQASGENEYEGESLIDFNGIEAQYLLITTIETHGGTCAGLAEIRLEIDAIEDSLIEPIDTVVVVVEPLDSICITADVYPNPTVGNELFIELKTQCVNAVHYSLKDVSGRVIIESTPINLDEKVEIIKGLDLANGVYILEFSSNYARTEYKVVIY